MTAQTPGTDRAHETHDRLLVARFALGDALASDEAASVRALLATCPDCTTLMDEMRVVQRATARSLAPARPRDFRITPGQAATLRPNAWGRLLGRFSAPRLTTLRPLAGATLAIGIVLVGAGAAMPRGSAPVEEPDTVLMMASPPADEAGDTRQAPAGSLAAHMRVADPDAKATPSADGISSTSGLEAVPEASPEAAELAADVSPAPTAPPTATQTAFLAPDAPQPEEEARDGAAAAAVPSSEGVLGPALLALGVLLAAVSALLLALVWLARRSTDPLLR